METLLLSLLLIFLTFGSGFFSSSEVALFSLSSMQIHACRDDSNPRKQLIATLLAKPRDLLVTVFMLNTVVNILLQNTASDLFGAFAGWGLKVGVPLAITLVIGEIIPKNIGIQHNRSLAYMVAPAIDFCQRATGPIRRWVIKVTTPISRLLFFYLKKEKGISKDELQHALATSTKDGILSEDEAELARGYLNLQDATVKEIMRPKEDILYYTVEEPLTKLIYLFVDQQCARVPICSSDLQNVLGVMSAKTFFLERHNLQDPKELSPFLDKAFYLPETIAVKTVLKRLTEYNEKLALVVDEYGSVSGLLTDEDIAELVVGEISDLRDTTSLYTMTGEGELICDGRLELHDFASIFDVALPTKSNAVTLAGWLLEKMGTIPKVGSNYETADFVFQVLAADPNRVKRIYVRKRKEASS